VDIILSTHVTAVSADQSSLGRQRVVGRVVVEVVPVAARGGVGAAALEDEPLLLCEHLELDAPEGGLGDGARVGRGRLELAQQLGAVDAARDRDDELAQL